MRMLSAGSDPEAALRFLANTLTNKLMHAPTVQIRRAGAARTALRERITNLNRAVGCLLRLATKA